MVNSPARLPVLPKDIDPLWFSRDGKRVIVNGKEEAFRVAASQPGFAGRTRSVLVRLLTGRDIDDANGLPNWINATSCMTLLPTGGPG